MLKRAVPTVLATAQRVGEALAPALRAGGSVNGYALNGSGARAAAEPVARVA